MTDRGGGHLAPASTSRFANLIAGRDAADDLCEAEPVSMTASHTVRRENMIYDVVQEAPSLGIVGGPQLVLAAQFAWALSSRQDLSCWINRGLCL
jgi:hypothetical protein